MKTNMILAVIGLWPALLGACAAANLALDSRLIWGKPQAMRNRFDSIYSHGIIRAAVCLPSLRVADPDFNLERTRMS